MKLLNNPSDAELIDTFDRWLNRKPKKVTVIAPHPGSEYPMVRIGTGSTEVGFRIALRKFLQRVKMLPPDQWDDLKYRGMASDSISKEQL